MKRTETISKNLREDIKRRIDTAGRQAVAEVCGFRYGTLSDKLNGRLPLTPDEYNRITRVLDSDFLMTDKDVDKDGSHGKAI